MFSLADLKMNRLLDTFDEWALTSGRDAEFDPPERFAPTRVPASARLQLDLRQRRDPRRSSGRRASGPTTGGSTCPWSTRRASCATTAAWSTARACTRSGLPVLRRRKSTFIYGIEDDAREVIDHLAGYLAARG